MLGSGLWNGFQNHELNRVWATLAYFGGPLILDTAIAAFRACGEQPTIAAHLAPDSGVPLQVQAVLAGLVLPHSGAAGMAVIPLQIDLLEAQVDHDPVRAEQRRDRVRQDLVRIAREHLAGEPITVRLPAKHVENATKASTLSATATQ